MNAFQFQTVPTIISEFGAARQLGVLLRKQYPAQVRLCLVTDGFLHKSGLLAPALADLARHGWQVTVIDDVVADPPESVVLDAAERARQADAEVVLGLGGGSSMDVACWPCCWRASSPWRTCMASGKYPASACLWCRCRRPPAPVRK